MFCLFIVWFRKTKIGQDMRALGQDMKVAEEAGIPVERTRIIAILISTILYLLRTDNIPSEDSNHIEKGNLVIKAKRRQ